jgi:hypothetical protein
MATFAQRPHPKLIPAVITALLFLGLLVAVLGVLMTAPSGLPK